MTNIIIKLETNAEGRLVFYPGHILRGVVELILDHPKKFRGFYIIIHGIAKCHWTEQRSRSVGTGKNRRTEHYTVSYDGNQTFLNSKTYLFGRSGADAIEMQPGTFSYNFACELPLLLPETLAASHGSIAYSVEAVLDIPWRFDKEIQTYFTVVRHDNLNDYPELRMAQRQEEIKTFCCLFCQSGPCMLTVTIPYGGYAAGQTIPIKIEYCNQSNVDVERTRIRLKRFTNFTSQTPETKTKSEKMDVVQIMVDGVKQGTNNNMECSLLLPSILVSSNGRFCRVVRTEYVLQVEGVVGDCHSNPKVNIPIEIGRVAIADFVQQPTTYFPQQPIVAPTAPLVDINSIDLPPTFDEAVGMKKPQFDINFQQPTSALGWNIDGNTNNQPSAPPVEKY